MADYNNSLTHVRHIATLFDGSKLIFAQGKFDEWCIYHVSGVRKHAIKDSEIFSILERYASSNERFRLNTDFLYIFHNVTKCVKYDVVHKVKKIAKAYTKPHEVEYMLTFLYAGMVAEENKRFARLKKYIKRLGVHQVLIEGHRASWAANYSRGKKWQELQQECDARGFYNNKSITKLIA